MTLDLGYQLKAVRMMHGLSQRELAKRAGVTNGTISLIEQNRVSPSVNSLKKVLDGIPMSLSDFFSADAQVFYRRDELFDTGNSTVAMRLVAARRLNRSMTIMRASFLPGADTGSESLSRQGEEGGIVVTGSVEVTIGNETRVLGSGDAFYFARSMPHRFRNLGTEPCEIFSAGTPALL